MAHQRDKIGSILGHLLRDLDLGIEVTDSFFPFFPHPVAVPSNILCQSLGPAPIGFRGAAFLFAFRNRAHRFSPSKFGRDFDHGLVDQNRHGIEVRGPGFKPQTLGLKRDRPSPCKGIVKGGKLFGIEELFGLGMILVQGAGLQNTP
ncbi:MAG: hypothetical protein M0041_06660, partial [Nitrospiraceae bacterium]|nr:hypothetical protein [Nitrospiraceae bacterium]